MTPPPEEGRAPSVEALRRRNNRPRTGNPDVDAAVLHLLEVAGITEDTDMVTQLVANAIRVAMDGNERGDIKLLATALRDLRRAEHQFRPYTGRRKCSIFGSARTPPGAPAYESAVAVGRELAAKDWMVITGGGPGIMTAGIEGAGRENSFGVTIRLPFEPMDAGGIVPDERLVRFRHFFTRKLTFMKESSAYVVFPGGFGTMDETFELLTLIQTGKEPPAPVVLYEPDGDNYWGTFRDFVNQELITSGLASPEDLDLVKVVSSPTEAVAYIDGFYEVFHSMRYVEGRLVIRLAREISDAKLTQLNIEFADLLLEGSIDRTTASEAERVDDDEVSRPRLLLSFDNRHFGRLHQLVRSLAGDV